MSEQPNRGSAAVCERHGLRFDPERQDGCVLCRRERAGASAAPTAGEVSAGRAWLVAVLVWVVSGAALYTAHREVLAAFAVLTGEEAAAPGEGMAGEESGEPGAESDPALLPDELFEPLDAVPYDPTLDGTQPADEDALPDDGYGPEVEGDEAYGDEADG